MLNQILLDPIPFRTELLRTAATMSAGMFALGINRYGVESNTELTPIATSFARALLEACGFVEREECTGLLPGINKPCDLGKPCPYHDKRETCLCPVSPSSCPIHSVPLHSQPATCQVISTMLTSMPPKPGPKCGLPLPCRNHP